MVHIILYYFVVGPVDGSWGAWQIWTPCSQTCGVGTAERVRSCSSPVPAHGGADCQGKPSETKICNKHQCKPVDGLWGSWRPWSKCSKTCGGGTEEWSRNCDSPTPSHGGEYCQGEPMEVRLCNKNQCKLNYYFNPSFQNSPQSATNCNVGSVSGSWGSWTDWSKCSRRCGGGIETRR